MADRKLFESEALAWIDTVYRAAMALCGQAALADDLLQATYLKAWERFGQFAAGTNCRAWLLTILRNTWVDHLRQRGQAALGGGEMLDQVAAAEQTPDPPPWHEPEKILEGFDDERLVAALTELPEDFRLALFLVDVEEYRHEEAARVLGVAVGTIKSRTSRARKMIQRRLNRSSGTQESSQAREGRT